MRSRAVTVCLVAAMAVVGCSSPEPADGDARPATGSPTGVVEQVHEIADDLEQRSIDIEREYRNPFEQP